MLYTLWCYDVGKQNDHMARKAKIFSSDLSLTWTGGRGPNAIIEIKQIKLTNKTAEHSNTSILIAQYFPGAVMQ